MNRGHVTEVEFLIPGDRFYKLKDKGKKVLEWDMFRNKGKFVVAWTIGANEQKLKPILLPLNTEVVYLRSTSDIYAHQNVRKTQNRPPEQKD